ncbi:hypothetical protein CS060_13220 [Anoxybacillus flavithermus]|uniref:Uncharacterized protein n=1 Tax=Anoxybacillus flavithermus TaxID=33934 RepID=A0A2G5RM47_9BACL|nr:MULTISPECIES: hypothetical protein [Anoxybacillus]KFZ42134.1 hypothetical protein JS80_12135 [Anoxybacillus sp. KU2-6(11)]PIC03793.1 hypothetical protein CS060_13220 [Anoxybacillus flavithermus]
MKRLLSVCIFFFVFVIIIQTFERPTRETIMFFPIDPTVRFTTAATKLSLQPKKKETRYVVNWIVTSSLDRTAYLRQDISLLFANGRLISTQSKWKENGKNIIQQKQMKQKGSRLFQAISYHQGELHNGNDIRSSQKMSGDVLYVIDSSFAPLQSFRKPTTAEQKTWANTLNKQTQTIVNKVTNQMDDIFEKDDYYHLYLPELVQYNEQPFMDLTTNETETMIGNLWEGLYKNYFLGIKKQNGSIESPIGSTVPLILIKKDYSKLFVVTEAADGELVILKQLLEFTQ